jgi:hypothetical protein
MASSEHTTKEKKMSKTVNIVAYLKVDNDLGKRDAMAALDTEGNYEAMREYSHDRYYLVTHDGVTRVEDETYEQLKGIDSDDMMVCHAPKTSESPKRKAGSFTAEFRRDVTYDIDMVVPGSDMRVSLNKRVKDNGRTVFSIKSGGPTSMGLLKHPSKVEDSGSGDIWEDREADMWAVTLTCKVNEVDPTVYRWFDNEVIPEIKAEAATHDWVERTRVMDCSKEMTEEGACYDVF